MPCLIQNQGVTTNSCIHSASKGLEPIDVPNIPSWTLLKAGTGDNENTSNYRAFISCCDSLKRTPLMHAALFGHLDVVRKLLNAGADGNATNEYGHTALMMACWQDNVPMWLEFYSRGYCLTPADNLALVRKQEVMTKFPSAAPLLQLPIGCASPALVQHQGLKYDNVPRPFCPFSANIVEFDIPSAMSSLSSITCPDGARIRALADYLGEDEFSSESLDCETVLWDAKCFAIETVASGKAPLNPEHVVALYLYRYPWRFGHQLQAALNLWDKEELSQMKPFVLTLKTALEVLPNMQQNLYFKPIDHMPNPNDYFVGQSFVWLGPVTLCLSLEQARPKSPHGYFFQVSTSYAKDLSRFLAYPAEAEAILPFGSEMTVTSILIDGNEVQQIPELNQDACTSTVVITLSHQLFSAAKSEGAANIEEFIDGSPPRVVIQPPQILVDESKSSSDDGLAGLTPRVRQERSKSFSRPPLYPELIPVGRRSITRGCGSVDSPNQELKNLLKIKPPSDEVPPALSNPSIDTVRRLSFTIPARRGRSLDLGSDKLLSARRSIPRNGGSFSQVPEREPPDIRISAFRDVERRPRCRRRDSQLGTKMQKERALPQGAALAAMQSRRAGALTFLICRRHTISSTSASARSIQKEEDAVNNFPVNSPVDPPLSDDTSYFAKVQVAGSPNLDAEPALKSSHLKNEDAGLCGLMNEFRDSEEQDCNSPTMCRSPLLDIMMDSSPEVLEKTDTALGPSFLGNEHFPLETGDAVQQLNSALLGSIGREDRSPSSPSIPTNAPPTESTHFQSSIHQDASWRPAIGAPLQAALMALPKRLPAKAFQVSPSCSPASPLANPDPGALLSSKTILRGSPGSRLFRRLFRRHSIMAIPKASLDTIADQ